MQYLVEAGISVTSNKTLQAEGWRLSQKFEIPEVRIVHNWAKIFRASHFNSFTTYLCSYSNSSIMLMLRLWDLADRLMDIFEKIKPVRLIEPVQTNIDLSKILVVPFLRLRFFLISNISNALEKIYKMNIWRIENVWYLMILTCSSLKQENLQIYFLLNKKIIIRPTNWQKVVIFPQIREIFFLKSNIRAWKSFLNRDS